jgi:hypothetical protein
MKKASCAALFAVVVVAVLLCEAPLPAKAVTCNPMELTPCASAIFMSTPPTNDCCAKLKEQTPCFCEYINNPDYEQFVNSPAARMVASKCGVTIPSNC